MSLEHCRVVLIETHYPGNLGATARAMRNFGVRDLVLVAPIADRHERNAKQMATHGESILNEARIVADLNDAIADCVLVVGTTGHSGGAFRQQNVATPAEIAPRLIDILKQDLPAAIVFGPEPTGLSNEIVKRCHHLVRIPTADHYASLNLAHAVAVCLYELHACWLAATRSGASPLELAPFALQDQMFHQLQSALEEIHFLYGDKADTLMHAIRHMLGKAQLTEMETKILLGLARQIHWFVENHGKS